MADDNLLKRLEELMAATRTEMRLTREDAERRERESRAFMQEVTARIERIGRDELRHLADLSDLVRAQTDAIFSLIDRSGPEPNGA